MDFGSKTLNVLISPARVYGITNFNGLTFSIASYVLKHITLLKSSQELYETGIISVLQERKLRFTEIDLHH